MKQLDVVCWIAAGYASVPRGVSLRAGEGRQKLSDSNQVSGFNVYDLFGLLLISQTEDS